MIEINKIKPGTIMKAKIPKLNKIIVLKVYNNAMEKNVFRVLLMAGTWKKFILKND